MKIMHTFGILLMILMITGCSSVFVSNKQLMEITPGMTTKDVLKVLGTPDNRRFEHQYEEWEYLRNTVMGETKVILVRFVNHNVVAMESFDHMPVAQPALPVTPRSEAQ